MLMREKIVRSRLHAQVALNAYTAFGGADEDLAAIGDLIEDLLHLADSLIVPDPEGEGLTAEVCNIADRASFDYVYESNPAHADEEV